MIAVEANPATASTLRRHIAMNDIGNIEVLEMAAWDRDEDLVLSDPNGQAEGGSTRVLPAGEAAGQAHGHRLDVRLADEPRIDLVKLDVEGADIHAIEGMSGLLERCRPVLLIEDHSIYGYYSRADLEAALTRHGYTWEVAHSGETVWMPDGIRDVPVLGEYLLARPWEAASGAR